MKTKKLELKHLAAYLPYNVKMFANGFLGTLQTMNIDNTTQSGYKIRVSCSDWWENNNIDGKIYKPILRPISDLTKEIEVNGEQTTPIDWIWDNVKHIDYFFDYGYLMVEECNIENIEMYPYNVIKQLLSWHFDVFGLIQSGLAIDINTLTQPK